MKEISDINIPRKNVTFIDLNAFKVKQEQHKNKI